MKIGNIVKIKDDSINKPEDDIRDLIGVVEGFMTKGDKQFKELFNQAYLVEFNTDKNMWSIIDFKAIESLVELNECVYVKVWFPFYSKSHLIEYDLLNIVGESIYDMNATTNTMITYGLFTLIQSYLDAEYYLVINEIDDFNPEGFASLSYPVWVQKIMYADKTTGIEILTIDDLQYMCERSRETQRGVTL